LVQEEEIFNEGVIECIKEGIILLSKNDIDLIIDLILNSM
jgi:hypothetical protein